MKTRSVPLVPSGSAVDGARGRDIAIVGAGLSGLACAARLQSAGFRVRVLEKSREAGGRLSTRRGDGWQCDHGAQYFTARDAGFREEVTRWIATGVAARWDLQLRVLGGASRHQTDAALERFVGVPGMSEPAAWMARTVPIEMETTIVEAARQAYGWRLRSAERGLLEGSFAALVLALPAPQAASLLREPAPKLAGMASAATMRGCWALMVRLGAPSGLDYDAAFVNEGPLRWIARDSGKPGRAGPETWLLHASAEWSEPRLEDPVASVAEQMLRAFRVLGGPDPLAWTAHRWRYADTASPLEAGCAWDDALHAGLCGDWLNGGRVEGAWRSGRLLAQRIVTAMQAPGTPSAR